MPSLAPANLTARPCRTCAAPIVFVREVDSGRVLVLNRDPVDGGNVVLVGAAGGRRAQVVPGGAGALRAMHFRPGGWAR